MKAAKCEVTGYKENHFAFCLLHFAFCILHFSGAGEGIKNTHPLNEQGWDTKVFHGSTLVAPAGATH